jgi:hypothetical protein
MAELEGLTIRAKVVFARTTKRDGRIRNNQSHQEFTIRIGGDDSIAETEKYTTINQRGEPGATRTVDNEYTLNKVATRATGGVVWAFVDGNLTRLSTRSEGARRMTFAFRRTPKGIVCKFDAPYVREDGVGTLKGKAMAGGATEFLSVKQVSSTCTVGKS